MQPGPGVLPRGIEFKMFVGQLRNTVRVGKRVLAAGFVDLQQKRTALGLRLSSHLHSWPAPLSGNNTFLKAGRDAALSRFFRSARVRGPAHPSQVRFSRRCSNHETVASGVLMPRFQPKRTLIRATALACELRANGRHNQTRATTTPLASPFIIVIRTHCEFDGHQGDMLIKKRKK